MAFQGLKKLTYTGPEGEGSCEFNYSRDTEIQSLGDSLVAVATTIIEGARLETLLQHDPLGLDQEIQNVQEAAGDGRAQQICSIRDILERLSRGSGGAWSGCGKEPRRCWRMPTNKPCRELVQ